MPISQILFWLNILKLVLPFVKEVGDYVWLKYLEIKKLHKESEGNPDALNVIEQIKADARDKALELIKEKLGDDYSEKKARAAVELTLIAIEEALKKNKTPLRFISPKKKKKEETGGE